MAVDAIKAEFEVYERRHLEMMIRKAYTGFVAARHDPDVGGHEVVATGHWGCGAFANNEKVMFAVQALAADLAGVRLRYHTPADLSGGVDLSPAIMILEEARLQKLTVDAVLDRLAERCANDPEWKTKARPPPRQRRWWFPKELWHKGAEA